MCVLCVITVHRLAWHSSPTFSGLLLAGRARLLAGAAPLPQLSQLEGDEVPHQPCLHEANGRQAVDSAKENTNMNEAVFPRWVPWVK